MSTTPQQKFAKCILILVLLPSAIITVPILILGSIFALAGIYAIVSHPLEIVSVLKSIISPKDIIHITPIAVPFGFWGLYTLWAVWDQISQGKKAAVLANATTHMGMCAGVISMLLLQSVLQWRAYPYYLPIIAAISFYWLFFKTRRMGS